MKKYTWQTVSLVQIGTHEWTEMRGCIKMHRGIDQSQPQTLSGLWTDANEVEERWKRGQSTVFQNTLETGEQEPILATRC